jgi:hypothetical protein
MSALHWFVRCGLGAVTLLLACVAATAWFGDRLQLSSISTRDGTQITFNRYIQEPLPDVVLVGSSVAFRLKEEYFAAPSLRNLALAGGSPVSGLEIVVNQRQFPKVILVEMNVLSRSVDSALVEKYSRASYTAPLFFRPVRTAVAAYENWLHAPLSHEQVSAELRQVLEQKPSDFDNHVYLDRALQELNAEDPADADLKNVRRIRELISDVEQRGAQLRLFELPYSAQIEETRSVRITHDIVRAGFPDPDRWLHIDYSRSELRWADGVHLDERSALIVARSIDKALASLLVPR